MNKKMANKILAAVLSLGAVMNNGGISSAMQGKEKKLNGLKSGRVLDYGKSIFKSSGLSYKDLFYSFFAYKFYTALKNQSNSAVNALVDTNLGELKYLRYVYPLSDVDLMRARYSSNNLVEFYRNYKDRRLAEKFVFVPVAYCVEAMHEVLDSIRDPEGELNPDEYKILPSAYFFVSKEKKSEENNGSSNEGNNNEENNNSEENNDNIVTNEMKIIKMNNNDGESNNNILTNEVKIEENSNKKIKMKNAGSKFLSEVLNNDFDYQKIGDKVENLNELLGMRERLFGVIFDRLGWLFDNFTNEELMHFGKISKGFVSESKCTWDMFVKTFARLKILIGSLGQSDDAFSIPKQYKDQWGSYVKRFDGFAKLLEKATEIPPSPTPEQQGESKDNQSPGVL